jgi:hypothetical protein
MKIKLLILLIIVVATGCQSLKFDRYPGEKQSSFPQELQGKYLYIHESNNKSDTDTIIVSKSTYSTIESGITTLKVLDAENVFSTVNASYFYFTKNESNWIGFEIKKQKEGLILIPIINPTKKSTKRNQKILNKYFEDVKLVSKSNNLENSTFSVKMNEENLLKYIKKINRFSIKLIQVKE